MINKEIGSDFYSLELQEEENHFFNNDIEWFISGRAALDFILRDIISKYNVKTIGVPSWCCDTMLEPITRNNLEIKFYSVYYENGLKKNIDVDVDILLNLDYFGYLNDSLNFNGIVITDASHSIFTNYKLDGDYIFGSLRKWTGFITGGFAYSKNGFNIEMYSNENEEYINTRKKAMEEKEKYINGKIDNKDYLNIFSKAEKMLDTLYSYKAYDKDIVDAKHLNIESIRNRRKENARELLKEVDKYAIFKEVKDDDCPLFVPIIISNRDKLRRYLIDKKIYCPIHWPISNLHHLNDRELYIYQNELSLVCDQRYNIDDMKYLIKCIREFLDA